MLQYTVLVVCYTAIPNSVVDEFHIFLVAIEVYWLVNVGEVLDTGVHRHHLSAKGGRGHGEHADVGSQVCNM